MATYIPLVGRVLLVLVFLWSGISKILNFGETRQMMAGMGLPVAALLLLGAIVFELVGAISVILGYKARWGALLLILFLIPTTFIFHTDFARAMEINRFLQNFSIVGGLLLVTVFGAGPISVDDYRARRAARYSMRRERVRLGDRW